MTDNTIDTPKTTMKIIVGRSIGDAWSYDIEDEWDDNRCENVCTDRIRNARSYVLTYQPMIDALERNCSHDEFETILQQMREELDKKFDIYFSQFFEKSDIEVREVVVGEFLIQKGLSGNEYLITKEDFHTSNFWRD